MYTIINDSSCTFAYGKNKGQLSLCGLAMQSYASFLWLMLFCCGSALKELPSVFLPPNIGDNPMPELDEPSSQLVMDDPTMAFKVLYYSLQQRKTAWLILALHLEVYWSHGIAMHIRITTPLNGCFTLHIALLNSSNIQ